MQGFRHFSSDQGTSLPGVSQKVFSLPGANSGTGSAPFVQGDTELTGSPPDPPVHIHGSDLMVSVGGVIVDPFISITAAGIQGHLKIPVSQI